MKIGNTTLRRIMLCLLSVVVFSTAWADSSVALSAASGEPGTEVEISMSLAGTDAVSGVQMTIPLPEYLSYVAGSAKLVESRIDGHRVTATETDGELRVMVYSLTKKTLKGTSGSFLTFRLRLGTEPDRYLLTPSVTLSGPSATNIMCQVQGGGVTIIAPRLSVDTQEVDFGIVPIRSTYTRHVTISNTGTKAMLVSAVEFSDPSLSVDLPTFTLAAGSSRTLTVTYNPTVRGEMQATMSFSTTAVGNRQKVLILAAPFAVNELHTSSVSGVSDTEVEVVLTMNNMDPITGVQCAFLLPNVMEYVDGSAVLSSRSNGHRIHASVNDRRLVIAIYSMMKQPMQEDDGEIARFRLLLTGNSGIYELRPRDVTLGVAEGMNVMSETYAGTVEIAAPRISCSETLEMPNTSVTEVATASFTLYNPSTLPLTVNEILFGDDDYDVMDELPMIIPAGSSHNISVRYTSKVAGTFSTAMRIYCNDPDNRMVTVPVNVHLYEPNIIKVECQGDGIVSVKLDNYSRITGLQTDIRLEGAHAASMSAELSERLQGYSYTLKQVAEDTWRLILFAFHKGTSFADNMGEILRIKCNDLTIDNTARMNADSRIVMENVVLSGAESHNYLTPGSSLSCLLKVATTLVGDVNHDGAVDLIDVEKVKNHILGIEFLPLEDADVNVSGDVSIADIIKIIQIINTP